jgi:hypothetical protein
MDVLGGCLFFFVIACVVCAFVAAGILFLVGTIMLLVKLLVWMAYLGGIFIVLGIVGLCVAKLLKL